ncbi:Uncharacterised protein [Vibrio cholerae]|nr:Uncharacterised protein [Vibrio cholerae]
MQTRVQGGRFTRAGWASHQNDPMRPLNQTAEIIMVMRRHTQTVQIKARRVFIQQTHYHSLTM